MKVNRLSISGCSLQDKWRHRHLNSRDSAFQNGGRFQVLIDFNGREDISVSSLVALSYILWAMNRCDNMKSGFIWTFKPYFLIFLWRFSLLSRIHCLFPHVACMCVSFYCFAYLMTMRKKFSICCPYSWMFKTDTNDRSSNRKRHLVIHSSLTLNLNEFCLFINDCTLVFFVILVFLFTSYLYILH